ncbi:LPS export ABC transporter permease LptF [bacterium]|nr:LPS export ABC transporter permease LptF [bacterium]
MLCYVRYIARNMIGPTLFITLSLTGIVWLAQSLRFIDLIVNQGLSISLFLYLTLLLMPSLLSVVLPVALFCATLYAYNRMMGESELVVLESAGISMMQLAKPALMVAAAMTAAGYLFTLILQPVSYREFKDMQFFIRNNYASLLLQEGVFSNPVPNMMVYIRKREPDGVLRGILVHDNSGHQPVTMMARQGYLVKTDQGPQFILQDGNRQEVNRDTGQLSLLHFDRYTLNLSMYTETSDMREREGQEMFVHELLNPPANTKDDLRLRYAAEAHQRLTWPFYNMVLVLMGAATILCGEFNRRGNIKKLIVAAVVGCGVIALAIVLQSNAVKHSWGIPLMYINLIVCSLIGLQALHKQALPWHYLMKKTG